MKHSLKKDGKKFKYFTTSMKNYRTKGDKYNYILKDLTLNLFSIEYIPIVR